MSAQDRVCDRVRQILQREFGRSLREKEEEAEEIERRLVQVRKALQMVRYGVVANYYSGGTLPKVRHYFYALTDLNALLLLIL